MHLRQCIGCVYIHPMYVTHAYNYVHVCISMKAYMSFYLDSMPDLYEGSQEVRDYAGYSSIPVECSCLQVQVWAAHCENLHMRHSASLTDSHKEFLEELHLVPL